MSEVLAQLKELGVSPIVVTIIGLALVSLQFAPWVAKIPGPVGSLARWYRHRVEHRVHQQTVTTNAKIAGLTTDNAYLSTRNTELREEKADRDRVLAELDDYLDYLAQVHRALREWARENNPDPPLPLSLPDWRVVRTYHAGGSADATSGSES